MVYTEESIRKYETGYQRKNPFRSTRWNHDDLANLLENNSSEPKLISYITECAVRDIKCSINASVKMYGYAALDFWRIRKFLKAYNPFCTCDGDSELFKEFTHADVKEVLIFGKHVEDKDLEQFMVFSIRDGWDKPRVSSWCPSYFIAWYKRSLTGYSLARRQNETESRTVVVARPEPVKPRHIVSTYIPYRKRGPSYHDILKNNTMIVDRSRWHIPEMPMDLPKKGISSYQLQMLGAMEDMVERKEYALEKMEDLFLELEEFWSNETPEDLDEYKVKARLLRKIIKNLKKLKDGLIVVDKNYQEFREKYLTYVDPKKRSLLLFNKANKT